MIARRPLVDRRTSLSHHHHRVQDQRFGRAIRALRRRAGLRQVDVAVRAGVSQATVSTVELGHLDRLQVATVRAVAAAVGAEWQPDLRWRGGELDRLLDEAHAALVAGAARHLTDLAWEVHAEVTYSVYGERGSIDLLGWHAGSRRTLVVEVKTSLTSLEETLRRHDAKVRLAPRIGDERFGWRAVDASPLLVLPAGSTARRHVARHAAVLGRAYPLRGGALRTWLGAPASPAGGLLFLSPTLRGGAIQPRTTPSRVRPTPAALLSAPPAPSTVGGDDRASATVVPDSREWAGVDSSVPGDRWRRHGHDDRIAESGAIDGRSAGPRPGGSPPAISRGDG